MCYKSHTLVKVCTDDRGRCAVTQTQTLMWTVKEISDGAVHIKGVTGDPHDWVQHGVRQWAMSYFSDPYARNISHRVALAFRYAEHDLSFSDRGFKNIYRIYLEVSRRPWCQTPSVVNERTNGRTNGQTPRESNLAHVSLKT